ncbi:MAG: hypothetical protein MUC43_11770 [Pirellula sp.]|jgi:putative peptide zinc metalloprotease protein|nr:hypothetical protein [Pirellula sp.]
MSEHAIKHALIQSSSRTPMRSAEAYRPQMRFDLEWIHYPEDHGWVAHDPLSNEFFRFNEYEYVAIHLMNGLRSLEELVAGVKQRFGRVTIDLAWMQTLVHRMQGCLLLQPTVGSMRWAERQSSQQSSALFWQRFQGLLAIRIPLFDPGSWLALFRNPAKWLFSRTLAIVMLLMGFVALGLLARWTFSNGVPQWNPAAVTIDRWILLLVCYGLVKSLHELGHMLACARYQVRSSEVGILLLCLMPCFYCDTTDAWRLPCKRQRAIISAAGIYVELIIAILATIGWLVLNDSTLSFICLNLMIVCSVSTVLLNANPLLRYDGYYILSDLWGVPNLHEQSRTAFWQMFSRFVLLQPPQPVALDRNPLPLAGFAIVSWVYRVFIMIAILWMVWTILPPMGLQFISVIVTASVAIGVFFSQKRLFVNARDSFQKMDRPSRTVSSAMGGLLLLVFVTLLFVPAPRYFTARGHIDYEDKTPIYATYDARVNFVAKQNMRVNKDSLVVHLESPVAELELTKLEGEIQQVEAALGQLKLRRTIDPEVEYKIPQSESELARLRARQTVLTRDFSQLRFYAPTDGFLVDSLLEPNNDLSGVSESRFKNSFLASENAGGWVRRSALLGWFCAMKEPVVIAIVPEASLYGFQEGGVASIRLDGNPFHSMRGRITRISLDNVPSVPASLVGDQSLVSIPKRDGGFETESPHYAVTIALMDDEKPLYDSLAIISVETEPIPIHRHISDFIYRSVRPIVK